MRGLYGGLTVEGGVLAERADANKKLYGRKIRAKELRRSLGIMFARLFSALRGWCRRCVDTEELPVQDLVVRRPYSRGWCTCRACGCKQKAVWAEDSSEGATADYSPSLSAPTNRPDSHGYIPTKGQVSRLHECLQSALGRD
jgi:hypothetical protein